MNYSDLSSETGSRHCPESTFQGWRGHGSADGRIVKFIGETLRTSKALGGGCPHLRKSTREVIFRRAVRIGVHVGDVTMAADGDLYGTASTSLRIERRRAGQVLVSATSQAARIRSGVQPVDHPPLGIADPGIQVEAPRLKAMWTYDEGSTEIPAGPRRMAPGGCAGRPRPDVCLTRAELPISAPTTIASLTAPGIKPPFNVAGDDLEVERGMTLSTNSSDRSHDR
jgi:hypothetical protein